MGEERNWDEFDLKAQFEARRKWWRLATKHLFQWDGERADQWIDQYESDHMDPASPYWNDTDIDVFIVDLLFPPLRFETALEEHDEQWVDTCADLSLAFLKRPDGSCHIDTIHDDRYWSIVRHQIKSIINRVGITLAECSEYDVKKEYEIRRHWLIRALNYFVGWDAPRADKWIKHNLSRPKYSKMPYYSSAHSILIDHLLLITPHASSRRNRIILPLDYFTAKSTLRKVFFKKPDGSRHSSMFSDEYNWRMVGNQIEVRLNSWGRSLADYA